MMNIQRIEPIRPLLATESTAVSDAGQTRNQPTMFQDIFQSMVDNVKETDAAKNEAYYALATGQLDNPAVASIAATQAELSLSLLIQMRNKALDAYSELMRISL
ncbi:MULTISPECIES: flagellar hook-basal body complex protein FliE [Oscillospiraceae]|uniref:flagellar hook-basal body complex protein FliE n=1 Tax=Oscillospiraceae TaxID=216572 RepID=UPI001FA8C518|nr:MULTISPECIES: flagellar hook-basal body complex protein FliE [Oscillospiraceae]